jgi:aryl-alcohol dehydrogenase-like predicted oxidoreductase
MYPAAQPDRGSKTISFVGCDSAVAPLGVGTWAWGDRDTWGMGGYDSALTEASIEQAWDASLAAGVTLFDTAEVYGKGESERIIGKLLASDPDRKSSVLVATKFMPLPHKPRLRTAMRTAVLGSLERLGLDCIDLYQIHGPISLRTHAAMADALANIHAEGLIRAVGVSNYSIREMSSIQAALAARGLSLASNQIEFSPLRRMPETSGLLQACRDLAVVPLAYSPIGQGRLTGKYSAANPPPGKRTFSAHPMERIDLIVENLRRIGLAHGDKTPSQVALQWIISKGAVPIPGAKNAGQATENAGALGWHLSAEQIEAIDALALSGQRTLQQRIWQHG